MVKVGEVTGPSMPSARQAPRIRVVLPAPTSPLTTTTSPGSSRSASSAPSASVSAAELVVAGLAKEVELVGGGLWRRLILRGLVVRLFSRHRRPRREQARQRREVLAQRLLHRRGPQRRRGVKERQEENRATADLVNLRRPVHPGDASRVATQQLGGEVAQGADDGRLISRT